MSNFRPKLSQTDLGHIRHMALLANQLPGDWSGMGADWWDVNEGPHQYQLAFMTYALGVVQNRFTPAYEDHCRDTIGKLIAKMLLPDVWQSWILSSRGGKVTDPDQEEVGPGWIDPLKKHNIMFKGHLLQMVALHEALYGTHKYVEPGAFTFEFKPTTWGNGPETFRYDLHDLARIVYEEYVQSNYEGVQCEPNRVFTMCNQHAILGLIHYDHAFGTGYAADVMPKFKDAWLRKGYTDLETGSHVAGRLVRQDRLLRVAQPWSDGWTGMFMHGWDRDFIQSFYPQERERHLAHLLAGKEHERACCSMMVGAKMGFGMFAAFAAEVGDDEAREALLSYADRNFDTTWQSGALHHPRSDDWMPNDKGDASGIDVLTANALLPMARMNKGNGIWDLYHLKPRVGDERQPRFSQIDQQIAGVSSAHYDAVERALHLSLLPGPSSEKPLSVTVDNLDRGQTYLLKRDAADIGRLVPGNNEGPIAWEHDGSAIIRVDASTGSDYVLAPIG